MQLRPAEQPSRWDPAPLPFSLSPGLPQTAALPLPHARAQTHSHTRTLRAAPTRAHTHARKHAHACMRARCRPPALYNATLGCSRLASAQLFMPAWRPEPPGPAGALRVSPPPNPTQQQAMLPHTRLPWGHRLHPSCCPLGQPVRRLRLKSKRGRLPGNSFQGMIALHGGAWRIGDGVGGVAGGHLFPLTRGSSATCYRHSERSQALEGWWEPGGQELASDPPFSRCVRILNFSADAEQTPPDFLPRPRL